MSARISLSTIVAFVYMFIATRYQTSDLGDENEIWIVSLFCVLSVLFIVIAHEAGHAISAKILGFNLYSVSIGTGRKLFEVKRQDFTVSFHLYPFRGMTVAAPATEENLRLRLAVFYAAGLLAQFLLLAIVWLRVGNECLLELLISDCSHHSLLLEIFTSFNFMLILVNLIPSQVKFPMGKIQNDGLRLFKLCFSNSNKILNESLAINYALRGLQLRQEKRYEEAVVSYEEGIKRYPESFPCQHDLGIVYLDQGEFEKAKNHFVGMLDKPKEKPLYQHILYNNIAWTNLFLGDSFLEEADKFSEEALRALPALPAFQGTRGAVLVRTGKVLEGLRLLNKAFRRNPDNESRAYNACWLAIGYAKRGEIQVAQKYLIKAKKLNPECVLLTIAEEEIEKVLAPEKGK